MNVIHTKNSGKLLSTMAKRTLAATVLLLAGLMISACSSEPQTDEEIVKERSQSRIDALLDGDVEQALTYTTPSYQKMTSVDRYNAQTYGAKRWTNATVDRVACEDNVCHVVVMVNYRIAKLKVENLHRMDEKWIRVNDQWWKYEH